MQEQLHHRQVVSDGVFGGKLRYTLLFTIADLSAEERTVGCNHTRRRSHFWGTISEVSRRLFCQRNAAPEVSLKEQDVGLQGSNLMQEGLRFTCLSDGRCRLLGQM